MCRAKEAKYGRLDWFLSAELERLINIDQVVNIL